jgi:hypothetical protein
MKSSGSRSSSGGASAVMITYLQSAGKRRR